MEREVTGLYLSGHPMDDYRDAVKRLDVAVIGEVLAAFDETADNPNGNMNRKAGFRDNQKVVLAGVIESVKTKPTRSNSLMAYLNLNDGTGSIELLAFQRVIDESGGYMQTETLVLAYGRITERDDKAPQIFLDTLRPITDTNNLTSSEYAKEKSLYGITSPTREEMPFPHGDEKFFNRVSLDKNYRTLFIKIDSEDSPEYERLKLVHMMFPGNEQMVIHFGDTKKNVGAKCLIHDAFVGELQDMLGKENIVIRLNEQQKEEAE